jgi:hypothetical protein
MTRHNGSGYETRFFWPLGYSARRRIVKELVAAMWCDHLQSKGGRWERSGGGVQDGLGADPQRAEVPGGRHDASFHNNIQHLN